jgi:ATP-binding cassette subfamily A (ABC1) protein 3
MLFFVEPIDFDSSVQHIRGVALVWMQVRALMWKNWLLLARSRKQTMVQLLMPAIIAAIALTNLPFMVPPVVDSLPFVLNLDRFGANVVVYSSGKAPVHSEATESLGLSYASQFDIGSPTKVVDMHTESQRNMFIEYMLDRCLRGVYWFTHTYIIGAEFVKDVSKYGSRETIVASAMFNNQAFHTPAISLGAVMNAILVHASGDPNYHITTVNHPLPITPNDILDLKRMEFFAFPLNVNIVMALCFVLSTVTLTIVKERASQLKHCQLLTGLSSSVYWLAITICYISMFAVMFALLIFTFYLFNIEAYINGGRVKLVILLCALFTWSSLPMTYLLTFAFTVPSTALVYTAIIYLLIGPVSLMLGDIMLFPVVNLVTLYGHFNAIMTAISPAYCLCKGMQNIYLNDAALESCGTDEITFFCSLGIDSPCCPGELYYISCTCLEHCIRIMRVVR